MVAEKNLSIQTSKLIKGAGILLFAPFLFTGILSLLSNSKNMNQLVLIGNGFDLAHGLKTKYSDFIEWYLQGVVDVLKKTNFYKDDILDIRHPDYSRRLDSSLDFRLTGNFHGFLTKKHYTINGSKLILELLISFNGINKNWVDIEAEYYRHLIDIYKGVDSGRYTKESGKQQVILLNNSFDFLKSKLQEYLTTISFSKDSLLPEITNHINEIVKQNDVLKAIGQKSTFRDIMFLNFNYTNTIEFYCPEVNPLDNVTINYIHGKLTDPNNPIIFGYGDEMDSLYQKIEELNMNEFLNHFKSFGYLKVKNHQNFNSFINSDNFHVSIFGHSCGLSDRVLLNSIFEHENCKEIKTYYHEKSETENDFFVKTQEISRHFSSTNKKLMRDIIKPLEECRPLISYKKP